MDDLFSSCEVIDAKQIIKSNIRLNTIDDDLSSLIAVLTPLARLASSDFNNGQVLNKSIMEKLRTKIGTLHLLSDFGFIEDRGNYIFESTRNNREIKHRENAMKDCHRLINELSNARNGNLRDLKKLIQKKDSVPIEQRNSVENHEEERFPSSTKIERGNVKTNELVKSLKESLKTKYNSPVSHSFIRLRIARILYRQIYPESEKDDDNELDQKIDRKKSSLKRKNTENRPCADQVYLECLIRAHFNEDEALDILQNRRPNLEVPVEPPAAKTLTKISINNAIDSIKKQNRLINEYQTNERPSRQISSADDRWEAIRYIVPILLGLRKGSDANRADEVTFSKMYRMLYSQLLPIVGVRYTFNIEVIVRKLCDTPSNEIDNVDITAIKNFVLNDSSDTSKFLKECSLCSDFYPLHRTETMFLCECTCCSDCVKKYYRGAIDDIQDAGSLSALTCYQHRQELEKDDERYHLFFVWLETKINLWFANDFEFRDKYHAKLMNATKSQQIKKCANPKCISSFYANENEIVARVFCPHCQFPQCGQCCRKWYDSHKQLDCQEYAEWLFQNDPEDDVVIMIKLLSKTAIVCPTCRAIYEFQVGGCEHFTCNACKSDFCRICSALFYRPKKDPVCPLPNCGLKGSIHAHCAPNCFREIRDANFNSFIKLLRDNGIDALEELRKEYPGTTPKCQSEECTKKPVRDSENKLCEMCYKYFLFTLVWKRELPPWELYEDNNLRLLLGKASIPISANPTRPQLIQLCQQHLNATLAKPVILTRPRV